MPDAGSAGGKPGKGRWRDPEFRDRALRLFCILMLLVLIGVCVVLVLGLMLELQLLVVAVGGVSSMVLAFYLFIRLWPHQVEPESQLAELVEESLEALEPEPLSPEEYRRQKELAQKMIREKAAPALAKAIRGILRQDELKRRKR